MDSRVFILPTSLRSPLVRNIHSWQQSRREPSGAKAMGRCLNKRSIRSNSSNSSKRFERLKRLERFELRSLAGSPLCGFSLRRAKDVDHRLALFHGYRFEAALEGRHHIVGIGDLFTVAVGNFHRLLVIRNAVEERDRLVRALGRVAVLV